MSKQTYFLIFLLGFARMAESQPLNLNVTEYGDIRFDDIPITKFTSKDNVLTMEVEKSSSAKILPFTTIRSVKTVTFDWRSSGEIKMPAGLDEKSKKADDAYFRLGLVIHGEKPFIPFFASAWIKKIAKIMKYPSDKMIYLIPRKTQRKPRKWLSPYSDSIENIAVDCTKVLKTDGWLQCGYEFNSLQKVVGIWLMADGDNTQSVFRTVVKNLVLSDK